VKKIQKSLLKAPSFWQSNNIISWMLWPLSYIYYLVSRAVYAATPPRRLNVPVICVGNLVMGGAGKTPTVIAIVEMLKAAGHNPHILSRGYGRDLKQDQTNGDIRPLAKPAYNEEMQGAYVAQNRNVHEVHEDSSNGGTKQLPLEVGLCRWSIVKVDPMNHSYHDVGDEPLLLSKHAPVWVGKDRIKTARAAIENSATVLVMDDGLQNPQIHKDFNIVVIDCLQGIGNGKLFPAGPLREPLCKGLAKTGKNKGAVVLIGDVQSINGKFKAGLEKIGCRKVFNAKIESYLGAMDGGGKREKVVAFAGIGYPEKFRQTLLQNNYEVVHFEGFPDHFPYQESDITRLIKLAENMGANIITTEKDLVRVPAHLRDHLKCLRIRLNISNQSSLMAIIKASLNPV